MPHFLALPASLDLGWYTLNKSPLEERITLDLLVTQSVHYYLVEKTEVKHIWLSVQGKRDGVNIRTSEPLLQLMDCQ